MPHLEELLEFHLMAASLHPAVSIVPRPHLLSSILLLTTHHLLQRHPTCNLILHPTQCRSLLLLIRILLINLRCTMLKQVPAFQPKMTNHSSLKQRMIYWTRLVSTMPTWLRQKQISLSGTNLSSLKLRMTYWTRLRSTAPL